MFAQSAKPVRGADETGTPRLEPGRRCEFDVPAGQVLSVGIPVRAWKEVEILIETGAPNAAYSIVSPAGTEILSKTVQHAGWIPLSFPISDRGIYQLEVRSNSSSDVQQDLRIRAELLPFATSTGGKLAQAEALYSSAENLRNSLQGTDVRSAIPKYEQAALAWTDAGHPIPRYLALSAESMSWLSLCKYRDALAVLDHALASLPPESAYFRSLLLSMKAEVHLAMWHNETAAAIGARALRIARLLKDPELQARALVTIGGAEFYTHAPTALGHLEEASRLATATGSLEIIAEALRFKSWIEEDQGHLSRSLALMQQSVDAFRKAGNLRKALQTLPYFADIESLAGDNYSALLANSRLVAPALASGDVENYGNILGNMGDDYRRLNRGRDAITYLRKAVQAYASIHHDGGMANYLGVLCEVELQQNLLEEALDHCQKTASANDPIHDPKRQAADLFRLGEVRQALGQVQLAVENYRRAANVSAQEPDPRFESQALVGWGDTVEAAGRLEQALPLFQKAFALSRQAEDPVVELEARFRIARWHANAGHDAEAISELKVALDQIEAQRSAVQNGDLRASYLAAERKCHQLYVNILMREHEAHPETASDITALEISESALARSLLDALHARGPAQSQAQTADAAADRIKLRNTVDQAYDQRLKLMLEGSHGRELDENSATLTQAIDSLERMDDAERDPANAVAPTTRSLTAQQMIEAAKSSPATLLEYALGTEESYLWVVRNGAIQSHVIHARQDEIETLVRKWRSLAAAQPLHGDNTELASVSAELSCKLVAPFLEPGMEKLAIVADGDLALLAFASLPMHGCDPDPGLPLITAHQVVMIPSLSIFLAQPSPAARETPPKEVALLADPVFDAADERVHIEPPDPLSPHSPSPLDENKRPGPALPRLTGTADEAAGIRDAVGAGKVSSFLGFSASVDTILSPAVRDYRILHIATHGVLDAAAPGLSGLVLSLVSSDGHPVPGFLKIDDIASLRLSSELVVLSSCDSGAGDYLGGEGVTGLSHAFLEAGAHRVVSSLWSVDDTTTRQLMVDFYREMFANGADPAEALRRSQLRMRSRPRRSAPYYWAGFEITSAGN